MQQYKVFAMPAGYSGCAFWRYRLPLSKLNKVGSNVQVLLADNPDKRVKMDEIERNARECQLVSMQAPGSPDANVIINFYKQRGKRVVVDYDDYSFDLDPGNPRYAELGTTECEAYDEKGNLKFKWRDGENGFDLKSNITRYNAFVEAVKSADLVTTTTEYLANKFRKLNPNVAITPNSVDFDLWKPIGRPASMDGQVRIGWFGGDSHFADLKLFKTLLPRICKRYPNVKIVLQAPPVPQWHDFFRDIPQNQLEWYGWADLKWYTLFLAARSWDIGLCPLADLEFNRCKSSIKFLEFAALKVPSVSQNMLPYAETVKHGETGYLAGTEEEWFEHICRLVENPALRRGMAEAAYQDAYANHNLDKNCRKWEQAYISTIEDLNERSQGGCVGVGNRQGSGAGSRERPARQAEHHRMD